MLRIDKLETYLIDLPTIRPHVLSMITMREQTLVIVRVFCSDGIQGIGEGTTIGGLSYGPESPESIQLTIDRYIAPILLGLDPSAVAASMAAVDKSVVENRFARAAVEMALLDAQGKRVGLPVSELLGGRQRGQLPVAWTLASGDTSRDIDEAERMLALRRHNIFKLKIGKRPLRADVAHVSAIVNVLAERASIRVDVNQAWDEATASCGISQLESMGVELVEQPLAAWNHPAMARLSSRFVTPIMADEMLRGPHDAFALAASASADVIAVKVAQSGGLYSAAQVAAIAGAAGVGLYGGTMLESSLGTAASAQLFATFPTLEWGTELFGPLLLTEEIVSCPLTYEDFQLKVSTQPGLGVELDEDRLRFFERNLAVERTISQIGARG